MVKETGLKLQVGVQGTADDSYSSALTAIKEKELTFSAQEYRGQVP